MHSFPATLLPCRICLFLFGFLLSADTRKEWRQEWFAELFWNWRNGQSAFTLYQLCGGCWADAVWHFAEAPDGREHAFRRLRSPATCISALISALVFLVVFSHGLQAFRTTIAPFRFSSYDKLMLVSRTGRLEAIRQGIPAELARRWKHDSAFVEGMAMCGFPRHQRLKSSAIMARPLAVAASRNLFTILGVSFSHHSQQLLSKSDRAVVVTDNFWRRQLHARTDLLGQDISVEGRTFTLAAVLPSGFWFLSPAVEMLTLEERPANWEGLLVVRARTGDTRLIENELFRAGDHTEYEFVRTAPHVTPLLNTTLTPAWLFSAALFCALTLVLLARGCRNILADTFRSTSSYERWQWSAFFALKLILSLTFVFLAGIEMFVGRAQPVTEALAALFLFWFYITACSLALFATMADQHARCRVCRRLLAFPIRIGSPGCLLLDWAGTEFLCPQGHGALYVPHHVACWEPDDRWIALEAL